MPGLARLNAGQDAAVYSLSCATVSHCTAIGFYEIHFESDVQVFVVSEK